MHSLRGKEYHNSLSPVKSLPPHVESAIGREYSRSDGRKARERLAQGEFDVLDSCRKVVGWRSVTSLAVKYYPLFPERHCWKRALSICVHYRQRWYTQTLSIRYLLRAVIQQFQEGLVHNFSGKLSDILNSKYHSTISTMDSILNSTWDTEKGPPKAILGMMGRLAFT